LIQDYFFSVVIPLFNKEKYIIKTLNSVFQQTFSDFEIIIVDDGSTDRSITIINEIEDERLKINYQKNQGASAARNKGIKLAKGRYIALLDADDIWLENHLQNFVDSINKFPEEKIFCNNYKYQFSQNSFKKTTFSNLSFTNESIILIENLLFHNLLDSVATSSSTCIKSSVLKKRGYDQSIVSGQDTELWIYLSFQYNFVLNLKESVVYKKEVFNSLSQSDNADSHFILTQKYLKEELSNSALKRFIDSHRFGVIIKYKLKQNKEKVKLLKSQINFSNLNVKQYCLINMSPKLLILLINIKKFFERKGVFISVFK